jgi:C1A family cysteine protease
LKYYDPSVNKVFSDCELNLNHAVLVVGYDQDNYLIKNSHGTDFGLDGYLLLSRTGNNCGVLSTMVVITE